MAKKPTLADRNANTGMLLPYAGIHRGSYDHDGVKCDTLLRDGKLSIALKGIGTLVAAAKVPTLPTDHKRPAKITLVFAGEKRVEKPYVIWLAESDNYDTLYQIKPDLLVVNHPSGVDDLLG